MLPTHINKPTILTTTNTFQPPNSSPNSPTQDSFIINSIHQLPAFVLEYAPLVHLNSNEPFWPASLEEHLKHTVLHDLNGQVIDPPDDNPFSILADKQFNHEKSYLTSSIDVRSGPHQHDWLVSLKGKPGIDMTSTVSPAILILVDKSILTGIPGTLDAFWFFFYSFNLGPTVANIHFGNHIADWEHCMMRFENGKPKAVHLSSHADGFSYTYECLEKWNNGKRPIIFSALGSHAMYPKSGIKLLRNSDQDPKKFMRLTLLESFSHHDYSSVKLIGPSDHTDRGPLWDPSLNYSAFQHYPSPARDKFRAIDESKDGKLVPCLQFRGQWGDRFSSPNINSNGEKKPTGWMASLRMLQQPMKRTVGLHNLRWGDGVTGPRDKDLDRVGMNRFGNHIRTSI